MLTKELQPIKSAGKSSEKYVAPKLSVYGSMTQLTAAGSTGVPELKSSSPSKVQP